MLMKSLRGLGVAVNATCMSTTGDPGSSRFYLSLEDDLMRIFAGEWVRTWLTRLGMQEGEAIESKMVSRRIEGAQKKVEERNFEIRKNLRVQIEKKEPK